MEKEFAEKTEKELSIENTAELTRRIDRLEERLERFGAILETVNIAFAGRLDEITKEIHEMKSDIFLLKRELMRSSK